MRTRLSYKLVAIVAALAMLAGVVLVSAQEDAPPYLGITFRAADEGAAVVRVLPDSPADEAGLERGDIITGVNGESVSAETIAEAVSALSVGDEVALDVLRDDETLTLTATLTAQPERPIMRMQPFRAQRAYIGMSLEATDAGVRIAAVSENSPAADAELQVGDIITAVDGTAVEQPNDVAQAIASLESGAVVTLSITRDGESQDVTVTLASMPNRLNAFMGDVIIYDGTNWQVVNLSGDNPLAAAGLQAGDVITAFDGEAHDPAALAAYLESLDAGAEVVLSIERDDETLDVTVSAADLDVLTNFGFGFGFGRRGEGDSRGPRFEFRGPRGGMNIMPGTVRLGITYQDIDADVAAENDLSVTEGALVTDVLADSPADEAGLQAGDVIAAVSGDVVDAQRTLRERLLAYAPGDVITLDVLRDGESLSIEVTLAEVDMQAFMDMLPFEFGGEMPRFFFGPDGGFQIEPPQPAPDAAPPANM